MNYEQSFSPALFENGELRKRIKSTLGLENVRSVFDAGMLLRHCK